MNKISPSLEDYLEKIYFLHLRNSAVRVTDVAMEMNISKPSVNKAINILKGQGYVNHETYGLLSLTKEGEDIAVAIAKRHRMLTRFLVEIIGVDEKTAEQDACVIEHLLSPQSIKKIELFAKDYINRN